MSLRKMGRIQSVALAGLALLGILGISGWLWLAQVSDRVLNSLNQQTGQRFLDKDVVFDPWQRTLSVNNVEFELQGVQISAERLRFVLKYQHWWEPWLGENSELLSAIELDRANIAIDPERLVSALPGWFRVLTVNRGSLSFTGIDQSLGFDQLTVAQADGSRLTIQLDNQNADNWSFSGSYQVSEGLLNGEVRLVKLSLLTLVKAVLPEVLPTLNNELFPNDGLGTMNGTLSLSWDKQAGLTLKGNAQGQSGQLLLSGKLPGISAEWQRWQLSNVQFYGDDPAQSTAELSISGLDVRVPETLTGEVFPIQSIHTIFAVITSLSINDSRLEFGSSHSHWIFEHVNGRLFTDAGSKKGKEKDSRTYQARGVLANVGDFQLSGQLSGSANDYAFQLNSARLAGPLTDYSVFAGYNWRGTQFDLSYHSQCHTGQVDISNWQTKKVANALPVSSIHSLAALITDKSGKAAIPFAIKPGQSNTSLPERIHLAVEQRLMAMARTPFDYLFHATGHVLEPVLHHEAGKTALTKRSRANLESLVNVLSQRPQLRVLIEVGVSESRDWPELSRHELEEALLELYSATRSAEPADVMTIPPGKRASLLEQMYLATRWHQKIPEVGGQSHEQRVEEAETWLLKNWPKTPDQIANLQKARYDYLKHEISRTGMVSGHIELTLSSDSDRKGSAPESVLTLR
ncbi:hypothetical protein [Endozoicomonas sp. SCSIO W0465]|uniref:DUF748 domain-containing protein n=1 Tax=Endozoicomonas sp. SCSIO W0465 TaxID=2918516 RepID=UPI0020754BFC|nr:hypothetical protein [Endozoicomonas sp. SCSIO W0465]USE34519.1 hypothetical protein MJO57_20565 [Endozoicomonas sp. SCSIO W0465]